MNGQDDMNRVWKLISLWLTNIKVHNAVGFFDINSLAEGLAVKLLNEIYGYNLENLNYEKNNYPGIDLGDKIDKIGFQISTRKGPRKFFESLEKFAKGPHKTYINGIRFLILTQEKKPRLNKKKCKEIYPAFDPDRHILTANDLLKEIRQIYDNQREKFDSEDTGYKYFKNYTYREYNHHPQNWVIAQDKEGIIYVANQGGVLIYDGVSWGVIGIPEYAPVRSLAIDENGTVYIGGKDEIGYLKSDEKGVLQYVSLMDQLEEDQRKFSEVWRTVVTNEGIYFSSYKFLFRWDPKGKQMKVWESTHRFIYSFSINGKLLIHQEKIGIMHMVNDSLKLLIEDGIFADKKVIIPMIVPFDTDSDTITLLLGRSTGFYLFNGKTVKPFPTEVNDYLKDNRFSHGIRLSSGDFALATRRGGLVIMDYRGRLKYIFDKTSGIQDVCVYYVLEDTQGNIWLCLDNGISKIEYASPFFIYDNRSGLPRIILSVVRHNNDLYAGTVNGLYVLRSHLKAFQPVPGISGNCWSLLSIEDSILAATSLGVFQVDNEDNVKREVLKDFSYVLSQSIHRPNRIWCGTRDSLVVLFKKNDQWIEERRIEPINQEIRSIAEDKNGDVWLCTSKGGTLKLDFSVNINHSFVTRYDTSHGLFGGMGYVAWAAGHVIFATVNGIFRFDEENEKFIPDETLGSDFAGGFNSNLVFRLVEDKDKTIWFHSKSRNYKASPGKAGSCTIYSTPFRRIPMIQGNTIYPDPDGKNIWFGNIEGLIRYDKTVEKNYQQNFKTLVRKVRSNEKLIFGGFKNKTDKAHQAIFPIIEYKDRNLNFEFAAPFFEGETEFKVQYRFFLEGYDADWSPWDEDTKTRYPKLDPGSYAFRVQAKNFYDHEGTEDVFRFKVLPFELKSTIKKIFISYSHSDKKYVNRITIDLENAGMSVWVDEKKIKVGDSILKKIEEGISKCDFFCLVISRHSVNSKWVEREFETALEAQLSTGGPKILPLLIQDVEPPLLLKNIKYADFSKGYNSGFMQLLDAIKER
jgi:ligand-binding sensor domain-containing protein